MAPATGGYNFLQSMLTVRATARPHLCTSSPAWLLLLLLLLLLTLMRGCDGSVTTSALQLTDKPPPPPPPPPTTTSSMSPLPPRVTIPAGSKRGLRHYCAVLLYFSNSGSSSSISSRSVIRSRNSSSKQTNRLLDSGSLERLD